MDEHYPTVDMDFFADCIHKSGKVEETIQIGETFAYILSGLKPLGKRTVFLRITNGQVGFMYATGLAIKLGFMSELLQWYERHRRWKDGAYTV